MELSEIRKMFITLSGRFDLVKDLTTYADNGADFFLQEGSRFLDRRITTVNDEDSIFVNVEAGGFHASFAEARVIKELWVYVDNTRLKMRELTKERVRELFPLILSQTTFGVPAVYASVRGSARGGESPANFLSHTMLASKDINGVIFAPVEKPVIIEAIGKFYSRSLIDVGENYWSIHHAMLLVWAALYHLEISYRNSEGAKDWLTAINDSLVQIEMDHVEGDSYNLRQMGGRENE